MGAFEPRKTQTKVKHAILEQYLTKWGAIIVHGLRGDYFKRPENQRQNYKVRFVYVDCFSFQGRYSDEEGEKVFGSPIIGIRALEVLKNLATNAVGFTPEVTSILFEKKQKDFEILQETLRSEGYDSNIRETTDFQSLKTGEIAVIRGDCRSFAESLIAYTSQSYTWSFYLLDPYGSSGIPLNMVASIISQERADVMINFPYMDLHRKSGAAVRDDPEQEFHNLYHDEMYGNSEWRKIAEERHVSEHRITPDEMEQRLVEKYKDTLQQQDRDLAIKLIRLKFEDAERTMFYLFLTTHDGTGALELNKILDEAAFHEFILREKQKNIRNEQFTLPLFAPESDPARPIVNEQNSDNAAEEIYALSKMETISYREVLRRMANTNCYRETVESGVKQLKKKKLAEYDGTLNNKTVIQFK